jgi:magnesium transporter
MGKKNKNKNKIGLLPGSLVYTGRHTNEKSAMQWVRYGHDRAIERGPGLPPKSSPLEGQASNQHNNDGCVTWLQVTGLSDTAQIGRIGAYYNLHALSLEDILNANARPKFEDHHHYLFCDLKLYSQGEESKVSLILLQDVVISFVEKNVSMIKIVEDRIEHGMGRIRRKQADYLFYSLMDLIIDHFQVVRDEIEEKIDALEADLERARRPIQYLLELQHIRSRLIDLRRPALALKEITNTIVRNDSALLDDDSDPYYRDLWDHALHASEDLREMQERIKSTIEIALSINSFNLSQVMKRLTIFTAVFMPLTFITGIYGMNFSMMPLQNHDLGFWIILGLMFIIASAMSFVARKKKWV